jgi:hypothetical protein
MPYLILRLWSNENSCSKQPNKTAFPERPEALLSNLSAVGICVGSNHSSQLNDLSTWIKIMEYVAYGTL